MPFTMGGCQIIQNHKIYNEKEITESIEVFLEKHVPGNKFQGFYLGSDLCYGFASLLFNTVFDRKDEYVGTKSNLADTPCYILDDLQSDCYEVYRADAEATPAQAEEMAKKLKPGDFLALENKKYEIGIFTHEKIYGGHALIIMSVDQKEGTIEVVDSNFVADHVISRRKYTYEQFVNTYRAFAAYRYFYYD